MLPFSTLWKHHTTLKFSDAFRGYRKDALETNGSSGFWNQKRHLQWKHLEVSGQTVITQKVVVRWREHFRQHNSSDCLLTHCHHSASWYLCCLTWWIYNLRHKLPWVQSWTFFVAKIKKKEFDRAGITTCFPKLFPKILMLMEGSHILYRTVHFLLLHMFYSRCV